MAGGGHFRYRQRHLSTPAEKGVGTMTVHQGGWAYCAAEFPDGPYEWEPVNAISLDEVLIRMRASRTSAPASG